MQEKHLFLDFIMFLKRGNLNHCVQQLEMSELLKIIMIKVIGVAFLKNFSKCLLIKFYFLCTLITFF